MTRLTVTRTIAAPAATVFDAVSNIERLPEVTAEVLSTELLTEQRTGVGTRFRETRAMGRKEMVTELEVTEFVENERVRFVADSHGTVWDTVMTVREVDGRTELCIAMDARAHAFLPRLVNPILKGLFKRGIEKHMSVLQAYCERAASE